MSDRQTPWWEATGTGESFTLKVERTAKPPLPWTWEIVSESDRAAAPQRSLSDVVPMPLPPTGPPEPSSGDDLVTPKARPGGKPAKK